MCSIRRSVEEAIYKRLYYAIGIILILMETSSCSHKHLNCEEPEADVMLTINLCENEYQSFKRSDAHSRFVSLCVEGNEQRFEYFIKSNENKISFPLELEPGKYSVYAWADDCGECRNAATLPYIEINDVRAYHQTCDAQGGSTQIQVVGGSQEAIITLQRPLAKLRLIAEDATDKDLTGLTATISYVGFFPTMFNVKSFLPCDAATGYSFTNPIDSEVLGEDYIFADKEETFVNVSVIIRNQSGEIIATTTNIKVPYNRGHVTTISGKFLTNQSSGNGGVNIDTEWSGEYEVEF